MQKRIDGKEIKKAVYKLKCGKATSVDGITMKMFNI